MDMKEFVRVIQIPTANGQRLQEYGLFHCIFFALTIAAMVFAVIYTLKKGEKNLYFLYVLSSVLMWVGELYKQFCYSFKTGTFHYDWYSFPWQFCSTPLYTFLFCAIAKKGKLYDAVSAYNATYALFAGTCVMLYPSTLVDNYGISFQSLLHHALMMITGVSALVLYAKKFSVKLFAESFIVYLILFAVGIILNFIIPPLTGQEVNMYFVSKTFPGEDNPFGIFRDAYPYTIFLIVYTLLFTEFAALIAHVAYLVAKKKAAKRLAANTQY